MWVDSTQPWRGEQYVVRALTGSASTKPYRCPGCDQEIRAGTSHVVVWPEHDSAADHRRHWHNACWRARDRRTTRIQRSRNAPHHG